MHYNIFLPEVNYGYNFKKGTRRHLCFAAFKLLFVSTKIIYYNCFRLNACSTTKKARKPEDNNHRVAPLVVLRSLNESNFRNRQETAVVLDAKANIQQCLIAITQPVNAKEPLRRVGKACYYILAPTLPFRRVHDVLSDFKSVCVQPRPLADNVALPAFAAACRAAARLLQAAGPPGVQQSADISCLAGPQQQTHSRDEWIRRTDGRTDGLPA